MTTNVFSLSLDFDVRVILDFYNHCLRKHFSGDWFVEVWLKEVKKDAGFWRGIPTVEAAAFDGSGDRPVQNFGLLEACAWLKARGYESASLWPLLCFGYQHKDDYFAMLDQAYSHWLVGNLSDPQGRKCSVSTAQYGAVYPSHDERTFYSFLGIKSAPNQIAAPVDCCQL